MSDDERSSKKYTYSGGDWRRFVGKIRPDLYEKPSKAYKGKTLFHVVHMVPPRERGRMVTETVEFKKVPRLLEEKEGDALGGTPMLDQRGDPVYDEVEEPFEERQSQASFAQRLAMSLDLPPSTFEIATAPASVLVICEYYDSLTCIL